MLHETLPASVAPSGDEASAPLLPVRHPQRELFLCDVADAVLKDDMASMEHPFFALTTKPDRRIRRYENGNTWLEVVPSVKGLATIYDKDILIFATSQRKRCTAPTLRARRRVGDGRAWGRIDTTILTTIVTSLRLRDRAERRC